jgi:probable phosphomutase (TIGR03848 family)
MTKLLLIRHGMTDAIGAFVAGTRPGTHLNEQGREQAERLGERLKAIALQAVVSSPLERALETATPIAVSHGLEIQQVPALTEFEFGNWTGCSFPELVGKAGWQRFNDARSITRAPNGELMLEVQRRAVAALLDLTAAHPDGTVVAVSHGDVIRAVLVYMLGMPIDFYHRLEVSPAGISVITLEAHGPAVLQVNGDSVR